MVLRQILDIAMRAPVLPADTAHGDVGVADLGGRLEGRVLVEERLDLGPVAEQDEARPGVPFERERGAGNHHRRPVIAAHGV
jgi:hypothetical protein